MSPVSPIPEGYSSLCAYLIVPNAVEAIAFYGKAFGAEPVMRMPGLAGENSTMHAEIRIGNSMLMLSDENLDWQIKSAHTIGGSPVMMHLYVEDVDAVFQQAIDAGCEVASPVTDMFWGDRMGKVTDPFGYSWGLATHTEDVPPEQMATRQQEWMASMSKGSPDSE
jgi:PhnB protein